MHTGWAVGYCYTRRAGNGAAGVALSITNLCLPYQLITSVLACAVCTQHASWMHTIVPLMVKRRNIFAADRLHCKLWFWRFIICTASVVLHLSATECVFTKQGTQCKCIFSYVQMRRLLQLQQRWLLRSPVQELRTVPTSLDVRPCFPREPLLPLPPPLPVPARAQWRLDWNKLHYLNMSHSLLHVYWNSYESKLLICVHLCGSNDFMIMSSKHWILAWT